ncbi:MAG: methyltransferase domain-containing protein [Acidimicrobiales bacterium]|nr:methyltransferase domain-containing protein [Acidimicrobiales bacterium]
MAPTDEDPKALVAEVFSDAAPAYDQVIRFFDPFGRALVAAAGIEPGQRVLDVACGRGACLYPALEAVGPTGSVLGVDLAPGMVEALGAELAARGVANATTQVGDAEALDLRDGAFDVVTGGFMIFFLPEPDRALAEFARVLRPGGTVALTIFDGDTPSAWLRQVGEELFGSQDRRASEAYDDAAVLAEALGRAGLVDVDGIDVLERFRFASLDQLEAWHRSHFARLLLEVLDDEQLAHYRRRMAELLGPHRVGDGYELAQRARVVVARRP